IRVPRARNGMPHRMLPVMNTMPVGPGQPAQPPPGATIRPSRIWYVVAAVVGILTIAGAGTLIGLGAASFPNPTATVPSSGEPEQVQLDDAGLTIFIDQTGVGGRCEVTDSDGDTVALAPVKGNESIGVDDENWYVVLRSPGEVPAGKYRVACEAQTPDARFAVGPH